MPFIPMGSRELGLWGSSNCGGTPFSHGFAVPAPPRGEPMGWGVLYTGFFVALLLRMTGNGILRRFAPQNDRGERALREAPLQGEEKRRGASRIARAGDGESRGEGPSGVLFTGFFVALLLRMTGNGVLRRFAPQNDREERAMRRISRTI